LGPCNDDSLVLNEKFDIGQSVQVLFRLLSASAYPEKKVKVVISGTTGYVGVEAVKQSIRNPQVESIIALSRRPIPAFEKESKVKVVIVDDFLDYSDSVKAELAGANGCLW
jgi:precorrin isomerase